MLHPTINELSKQISNWRKSKKFITPSGILKPEDAEQMLGKLMLVVTEVGEAAEAVRDLNEEHFVEEIADTFIRLLDICGTMSIDIEDAILSKMKINEDRPIRHGRKIRL